MAETRSKVNPISETLGTTNVQRESLAQLKANELETLLVLRAVKPNVPTRIFS